MNSNDFNQCPKCGSKKIENVLDRKWKCPDCGFTLYNNVASAVGLVIVNGKGEVLLETRAKDPRKGFLAFPGGFVDPDESAEEACVRECREEIGVEPDSLRYLCSFPNVYCYKDIVYKTCDLFFEATLPEGAELNIQKSEVEEISFYPADTLRKVEELPLAFDSARKTLSYRLSH